MTLVFVLLLQAGCSGSGCAAAPTAIFETREACSTYATATYDMKIKWQCVPLPTRNDEGDELE
jgi:hypothetical protein